jgi:hypothetical protein
VLYTVAKPSNATNSPNAKNSEVSSLNRHSFFLIDHGNSIINYYTLALLLVFLLLQPLNKKGDYSKMWIDERDTGAW